MKSVLTKISYMAFGCLLTLIGYYFGNVDNNSADAQVVKKAVKTADELRCRRLVIVDDNARTRVALNKDGMQMSNEMGHIRISIHINKSTDGGTVQVLSDGLSTGAAAELNVDEYGGSLSLWNKFIDTPVLRACITDKGEGIVITRDRAGDQTSSSGSRGVHMFKDPRIFIPRDFSIPIYFQQ